MSNIPYARGALREIAETLDEETAAKIRRIVDDFLVRRRHKPVKAAPRSARMTVAMRDKIRRMIAAHPGWSDQMIANACCVNPGRVSEVRAGEHDDLEA